MSRLKAIARSFVDGMWFASYTVLPTIGVMWAMGIGSFNIEGVGRCLRKKKFGRWVCPRAE